MRFYVCIIKALSPKKMKFVQFVIYLKWTIDKSKHILFLCKIKGTILYTWILLIYYQIVKQ